MLVSTHAMVCMALQVEEQGARDRHGHQNDSSVVLSLAGWLEQATTRAADRVAHEILAAIFDRHAGVANVK